MHCERTSRPEATIAASTVTTTANPSQNSRVVPAATANSAVTRIACAATTATVTRRDRCTATAPIATAVAPIADVETAIDG